MIDPNEPVALFLLIMSVLGVPGLGSRKRVADTLGNLPEQLAASFDGNLAILNFDE